MTPLPRCLIVPGNGCVPVRRSNWYAKAQKELERSGLFSEVLLEDMPDPYVASESAWIPFLRDRLCADDDTVLVGHSSGAQATLRLLETQRLRGAVLVAACHTDLGDANERASGYYNRPWQWEAIAANAGFVLQWHSADDPFIPVAEARHVAKSLGDACEYLEHKRSSHFFTWESFGPELLDRLRAKLGEPLAFVPADAAAAPARAASSASAASSSAAAAPAASSPAAGSGTREPERCICCGDRGTVEGLEGSCPLCDGLGLPGLEASEARQLAREDEPGTGGAASSSGCACDLEEGRGAW